MPIDHENLDTVTKSNLKVPNYEAQMSFYKTNYDFINFDSNIKSSYENSINNAYDEVMKEKNFNEKIKSYDEKISDLEDTITETKEKDKMDKRTYGNRVTYRDVHEAWIKYQKTIPFTEESREARRNWKKIRDKFKITQVYNDEKTEKALTEKEQDLEKYKAKKAEYEQKALDAQDAADAFEKKRDELIADMQNRFNELDKIISLKNALENGYSTPNDDGTKTRHPAIDDMKFDQDTRNYILMFKNVVKDRDDNTKMKKVTVTRGKIQTSDENIHDINKVLEKIASKIQTDRYRNEKEILDGASHEHNQKKQNYVEDQTRDREEEQER